MNVHCLELSHFVAKHGGMTAWSGKQIFAELLDQSANANAANEKRKAPLK
jgi:hypothetical protein